MNDEQPEKQEIVLSDLCGERVLTGVDRRSEGYDDYLDRLKCREVFNFTLDGVTYSAAEDPDDGYRSSMAYLRASDKPTTNVFPPCKVIARMREPDQYEGGCDVLQLVDVVTGKVVLEVGTRNSGDWYPCWTAYFAPENMAINIGKDPQSITQV